MNSGHSSPANAKLPVLTPDVYRQLCAMLEVSVGGPSTEAPQLYWNESRREFRAQIDQWYARNGS